MRSKIQVRTGQIWRVPPDSWRARTLGWVRIGEPTDYGFKMNWFRKDGKVHPRVTEWNENSILVELDPPETERIRQILERYD